MWQLYKENELTFVQIAKKMRRSPDTVSRYVNERKAAEYGAPTYRKLY